MLKAQIYPKTKRIGLNPDIRITEKLDGSNLGFFKKDGVLHIAQRQKVYKLSEVDKMKDDMYKGLYCWLAENGSALEAALHDNSCLFGEWIGMGKLKYPELTHRFYMFAKANIDEDFNVNKLIYDHENFIYPFIDMVIPAYIATVPLVLGNGDYTTLSIASLDALYDKYAAECGRHVEGFVVNFNGSIMKYVRMKNAKLTPHEVHGD